MDIKDFQNNSKFKLYLPLLYVINWGLMITGPFFFPVAYQRYYLTAIAYLTIRSVMTFLWTVIGAIKANQLLDNYQSASVPATNQRTARLLPKQQTQMNQHGTDKLFYHAFIIPNFKQEQHILESTLRQIATHPHAETRFLVFLAMEAHEQGSKIKGQKLIKQFNSNFKLMGLTIHQMRQYEQKGKAANVGWCAEHLEIDFFQPHSIDLNQVILTIIDADSWVPSIYVHEVDKYLENNMQKKDRIIFQPCQMFTRNYMEVPALTRTYDMVHGLVHFSNLFSLFSTSFPLSNYSLSFALAKEIGFWDTCPDAIGQDFHTTIKAFWKTNGQVNTVSVFTPFNQINVQTGKGYWNDISKRFWQAERHGRGCADAAYCLNRVFNEGIPNWRLFLVVYQVLQITTMPAVLPWCMLSSTAMSVYYHFTSSPAAAGMIDSVQVQWLYNTCTLCFILSFFCYYYISSRASKMYYGLTLGNWLVRSLQFILWFIPNIFLVTVPSMTIAVFRMAFGNNIYEVAQKKASKISIDP